MSSYGTPASRQLAELELLKSIYDKDVRNDSNNGLNVYISLTPLHDSNNSDVHVRIILNVNCNENYPNELPLISLLDSKGLSRIQIEELQLRLEDLAKKLIGEEMIFQLAQCVQEYLYANNKPGTKSFYDEMQMRIRQAEQARSKSEEDQRRRRRSDIEEKVLQKELLTYSDEGSLESSEGEDEEEELQETENRRVRFMSIDRGGVERISIGSGDTDCEHRCCKYIQFGSKVLRGRCLEHEDHSVVYVGIDNTNGDPVQIREYILKPQEKQTCKELLSDVLKQLDSISHELIYLKKFRHENLQAYIDFKHILEKDHLVTYVVQEFVSTVTLNTYANNEIVADYAFIRHVVTGILRALVFLHQYNVVHKNLSSSSVYISKSGVVKVGSYGLVKRLVDLQQSCRGIMTGTSRTKVDRTMDVMQVGSIVQSLIGSPADAPSNNLPSDLKDFMKKCLLPDEQRWPARQLLEHGFVKTTGLRGLTIPPVSTSARGVNLIEDEEEDANELFSQLKIPNDIKYQSRLSSEFKVLKHLGSGSFGKVLKAKQLLDGGIYAIKAIELNQKNKLMNRKMIREVKLLSKLNHENVVRYYNSWIETTNVDDTSSVTQVTSTPLQSLSELQSLKALDQHSISKGATTVEKEVEEDEDDDYADSESDSSETEPCDQRIEPSESIVFENSTGKDIVDSAVDLEGSETPEPCKQLKFLYIQMEFCEKSTLRSAIDRGLCEDSERCWRLVREIVEGLEYIHQQDMIHRDLKPVNIFLDSSDHVKIGDFGLATTSVLSRANIIHAATFGGGDSESSSHLQTENSHTGGVGTYFYVAPELQKQTGKAHYSKMVDIYSLGIILFEMAHPPFTTNMERCMTLSDLRQTDIKVPSQLEEKFPQQMRLVRLLLNHDSSKRPTCSEILSSGYLPPPQVEDYELQEFLSHTLSNPQSKAYKHLISSCFSQDAGDAEKITYHSETLTSDRQHTIHEIVRDKIELIARRHGAKNISTPLFLPQTEFLKSNPSSVRLMTHSGSVVVAPYDLRVPFAWSIARCEIKQMRRYCVDRVYRERRTHGYHPREAFESCFDIVTPTPGDLLADAEMIHMLNEVINELPALKSRNCILRVNHVLLLKAILISLGIDKKYSSVFNVLSEAWEGKYSRTRIESCLQALGINDQLVVTLTGLCMAENGSIEISREIKTLLKRKEETTAMAKCAIDQIKLMLSHATAMGVKIPVKMALGVVHTNEKCSSIMFDLICTVRQKRKRETYDIIASGCRYDGLVSKFRKMFDPTSITSPAAVGMSISLDKLANNIREESEPSIMTNVVICSLGQDSMTRTKAEVARTLWAAEISCYILENVESLDELEVYCQDNKVSHIVWLTESERGVVRLRSWDRDRERYMEKRMSLLEATELIIRDRRTVADVEQGAIRPSVSDSTGSQVCNIYILVEDKLTANARRRYEMQVKTHMVSFLSNFSSRPTIEILGLFFEFKVIKAVAANLECGDDSFDFHMNFQVIVDKYPRYKKYLSKIFDKLQSLCSGKENRVVILYSLPDDKFKQIL